MSRHGYIDGLEVEDQLAFGRWRAQVNSAMRGRRGQAFLKELADEMDAMPVKELIAGELVSEGGECCAIGVVCKSRGVDVAKLDYEDWNAVGESVDIAGQMAAEIEYENDDCGPYGRRETPAERWTRMRKWVEKKLKSGAHHA